MKTLLVLAAGLFLQNTAHAQVDPSSSAAQECVKSVISQEFPNYHQFNMKYVETRAANHANFEYAIHLESGESVNDRIYVRVRNGDYANALFWPLGSGPWDLDLSSCF